MIKVMMAAPFDVNGRFQGGIHAVATNLLEAKIIKNQTETEIVPFNTCRVKRNNGEGKVNLENLRNFYLNYKDVIREMRRCKADVFYMHSAVGLALLKDLLILRHVKRRLHSKTVLHIHFADIQMIMPGKRMLDKWMLYMMKRYIDSIVFLSTQTLEQFVEQGIMREKCHVIYNFSTLSYEKDELFLNEEQGNVSFLFVGSLDRRKGIFDVLEVLTGIDKEYTIHVCGDFKNSQDEDRFSYYQKLLGRKLKFYGYVRGDQKRELFRMADVLVLPSYGEGLPVVIMEAYSAGCGVIATDVGAISEVVKPENGIIVKPGNLQELRKAITRYLENDKSALQKQKKVNFLQAKQYTLEMFARKVIEVCKK